MSETATCVLGLDPGLRHTGWGIIEASGTKLKHVAHGIINPPTTLDFASRLSYLFCKLLHICETYAPDTAAVEEVFMNANPASTLKLGAARGVVILAPAHYGIEVAEYATNRIKKATVGRGHASKAQMQAMIGYLLPGCGELKADSADALAAAICHSHYKATFQKIEGKAS